MMREKLIELLKDADDLPVVETYESFADYLIDNGVTFAEDINVPNKWIPVSERLPNADEDVWSLCETVQVLLKDGTVTVGFCNRGLEKWYHVPILATTFNGHSYAETPVVAWQPLSQPPKED